MFRRGSAVDRGRPAVGSDRIATAGQGAENTGTGVDERSACPARDFVRADQRRVGRAAQGTGVRVRHDLLAAATRRLRTLAAEHRLAAPFIEHV